MRVQHRTAAIDINTFSSTSSPSFTSTPSRYPPPSALSLHQNSCHLKSPSTNHPQQDNQHNQNHQHQNNRGNKKELERQVHETRNVNNWERENRSTRKVDHQETNRETERSGGAGDGSRDNERERSVGREEEYAEVRVREPLHVLSRNDDRQQRHQHNSQPLPQVKYCRSLYISIFMCYALEYLFECN